LLHINNELKIYIMKLTCRLTHNLAEIKVDEIEVTLFKSHPNEIDEMINNLLIVVDDLAKLQDKTVTVFIDEI